MLYYPILIKIAMEKEPQLPIERRPAQVLLQELQQTLRTFAREQVNGRARLAEQHIIPRLRALQKRRPAFELQLELYRLLTDFTVRSSAAADLENALADADLDGLLSEPVPPVQPVDETVTSDELLPKQLGMGRIYKHHRSEKLPARQPRDKGYNKQPRVRDIEPPDSIKQAVRLTLHDELFEKGGSIRQVTVESIFGGRLTPEGLISKDPELVRNRLTAIQESKSSSQLVDKVVQLINDYLRQHRSDLAPHLLIQSPYDREQFPQDDLVDAAVRRYLKGLLDWFPHVYNDSLDYPHKRDLVSKGTVRQDLRYFLRDGLEKCLNVINQVFVYNQQMDLARELNQKVNRIVEQHYFEKPTSTLKAA